MYKKEPRELLEEEIANLREELYRASNLVNHLSDPKLVQLSQQLDQRLNQLVRIISKKNGE